jgi:dCTP deaminase
MILSKHQIEHRLRLSIDDPKSLVVTPLLQKPNAFSSDSLDMRLGSHFLLSQSSPRLFFDPNAKVTNSSNLHIHVPLGEFVVVPAHQTILGATLEFIKLPFDVAGQILTKSSVARTFMVIETAPWVHPMYRGCLTLEIANVSNTPLLIYPGMPIGQLILMGVSGAQAEKKLQGTYLGPVYPEAPTLKKPKQELRKLGLKYYKDPRFDSQPTE